MRLNSYEPSVGIESRTVGGTPACGTTSELREFSNENRASHPAVGSSGSLRVSTATVAASVVKCPSSNGGLRRHASELRNIVHGSCAATLVCHSRRASSERSEERRV